MKKKMLFLLATLCLSALLQTANAQEVIKIGTLIPKSSPWGKVFETWIKAVREKSNGRLEIQIFYNGQQGDEAAMIGKMKSGQIDGAAVSSAGLGKIYKPVSALEIPGLFSSWAKLDKVRDAMKVEFEKGISDAGFTIVGWYDIGAVHLITKSITVKTPEDLKGKKPWMLRDDRNMPILYQVLGGVMSVPLNVPEVLPNLNTGAINALFSSSLMAEQLQWSSKLDQITEAIDGFVVGGIVFSSKRINALPEDLKTILVDTSKLAAMALTKSIRNEDAAAFSRLKAKMTLVVRTADEQAKWNTLFKQVRQKLSQDTYPPELILKLETLSGN